MTATHCDRPDCDTWATTAHAHAAGFVTVTAQDGVRNYCGWNRLLLEAAKVPPPTVIAND